MTLDRNILRIQLIDRGLARVANELANSALPCTTVKTRGAKDEDISIGSSKFGGRPDAPSDFDWPMWNDRPLAFLGQLNLPTVSRWNHNDNLPTSGLLSFFYDSEQSTWGFDPNDRGSWSVRHFEDVNLTRQSMPAGLPDDAKYTPCELSFGHGLTLPGWETPIVELLKLTDDEQDKYLEICDSLETGEHHLFGHPQEVQGAMQLECQLASNGIYCGDADGYKNPRVNELKPGALNWKLLLQLDSDDNANWMWGDCGCLYFWITRDDLQSRNFDRTWMVLQCC